MWNFFQWAWNLSWGDGIALLICLFVFWYGKKWIDKTKTSYTYSIYKDKAAREALPGTKVEELFTSFDMDTRTDAKNAVEQAYTHLKTKDVFKDMVDA